MKSRYLAIGALFALALLGLAACYVPDKFEGEVRLGPTGDFAISFTGDLLWPSFKDDTGPGKLTPDQETKTLYDDLSRDADFKQVQSLGNGRFHVQYQRQGHLAASDQATFIRRNEIILLVRAFADGRVTVDGANLKPKEAVLLTNAGISTQGEFRVIADPGLVKEQNATITRPFKGQYELYIWTIKDAFSPPPHFVMQRTGVYPATPAK